jgi:hypothetical protein
MPPLRGKRAPEVDPDHLGQRRSHEMHEFRANQGAQPCPLVSQQSRVRNEANRVVDAALLSRESRAVGMISAPATGTGCATGEEEGRVILRLGPCFCLTAGVPGGNLGSFWIRR